MNIKPIAYIKSDYKEKFGIPRQSGLINNLTAEIVFTKEYSNPDALRGIEDFSHIWLIFDFSSSHRSKWSPTVRPPRLGGNKKVGVFATRSPFRPNPIGLSCVKLLKIKQTPEGFVLIVSGADLLNNTPIIDIKPYLPYADCIPNATGGFTEHIPTHRLNVDFPKALLNIIPENKRDGIIDVLACDPRPSYQSNPERIYKMLFDNFDIYFNVNGTLLTVTEVIPVKQ